MSKPVTSEHRTAVVTGGARGLGAAVVARVRADGGTAVVIDALDLPGVDFVGDVTDSEFVDSAFQNATERNGPADLVVNCAGINGPLRAAVELSVDDFRRVVDVNLVGTFLVSRAAARAMISDGITGTIVNISSMVAQQAVPGLAGYASSKAAVTFLTQTLALELAPFGIRANTIAPGHIMSDLHMGYLTNVARAEDTTVEYQETKIRNSIPLLRHGTGEDIAAAIVWLGSPDASYVTGQTLAVNGGVFLT